MESSYRAGRLFLQKHLMFGKMNMQTRVLIVILLALTVMISGCSSPVGLEKRVLRVGDVWRTYWVHVPTQTEENEPLPLVLALHRFTETGPDMARLTGFNALADREQFIVAYPDGKNRGWNGFESGGGNDLAFLRALVADVAAMYPVDTSRVYITGASSGGYMALRAIVDARDVFAAAAVVMATMPASVAESPPSPAPILFMHGTEDPIIPYNDSTIFAGPGRSFEVLNVPDTVAFWAALNGCDNDLPEQEYLPDSSPTDGTLTLRVTYRNAEEKPCVVLYRVEGGGHTWPDGDEFWPRFIVGRVSRDFSASEAIWNFFTNWSNTP